MKCLFIPEADDLSMHLISYALAIPIVLGAVLWFRAWRRQWVGMKRLTRSLENVAARDERVEITAARLGLGDRVRVIDLDDDLCFCGCFPRCRVYISRGLVERLTPDELEATLLHEKYHLENHDSLKMLLGQVTVSFMFFTPVLKDLFRRYLIGKEIAADQKAIDYQGHRVAIVSTLQKMLAEPETSSVPYFIGDADALVPRVSQVSGHPFRDRIPAWHFAISLVAPVVAAIATFGPFIAHP